MELSVRSTHDGSVTIRSSIGEPPARTLAAFVLEVDEVYLSLAFDSVLSRKEMLRWRAHLAQRARRRKGTVGEEPDKLVDYVFTKTCGRRVTLPEIEISLQERALRAARPAGAGPLAQRRVRPLLTTVEWLKRQMRNGG